MATVYYYLLKVWTIVFPPLAAIFTMSKRALSGNGAVFLSPLLFSLTKVIYYLPYYYELYVLEEQMVSSDALLMSAILTAFDVALSYVHILIYALIALLVLRLFGRSEESDAENEVSPYDFSHPSVTVPLTAAMLGLLYSIAFELIDTVSFLEIYMTTVNSNEIATMLINYVLIIALHTAIHFVSVKRSFLSYYKKRSEGSEN